MSVFDVVGIALIVVANVVTWKVTPRREPGGNVESTGMVLLGDPWFMGYTYSCKRSRSGGGAASSCAVPGAGDVMVSEPRHSLRIAAEQPSKYAEVFSK